MNNDLRRVKYRVVPTQAALLFEVRIPLAFACLAPEQQVRCDDAFAIITRQLGALRDMLAAEVAERGLCPFCNDVLHPEGQGCA